MMKILFLDDDELRHRAFRRGIGIQHAVTYVKNAGDAAQAMKSCRFDLAFLDHDLAEEHYGMNWGGSGYARNAGTGHDVVNFIVGDLPVDLRPKQLVVHSMNPDGAKRMMMGLLGAGLEAHEMTFGSRPFMDLLSQIRNASI